MNLTYYVTAVISSRTGNPHLLNYNIKYILHSFWEYLSMFNI